MAESVEKICHYEGCKEPAFFLGMINTPSPNWCASNAFYYEFVLVCKVHVAHCEHRTLLCQESNCTNLASESKTISTPHPTAESPDRVIEYTLDVCKLHK